MAKKRTSFKPAAGLFEGTETEATEVMPPEIQPFSEGIQSVRGQQGSKALRSRMRRMNIPVTDEEYEAIRRGSKKAGMTYGEYVYTAVAFYELNKDKV